MIFPSSSRSSAGQAPFESGFACMARRHPSQANAPAKRSRFMKTARKLLDRVMAPFRGSSNPPSRGGSQDVWAIREVAVPALQGPQPPPLELPPPPVRARLSAFQARRQALSVNLDLNFVYDRTPGLRRTRG